MTGFLAGERVMWVRPKGTNYTVYGTVIDIEDDGQIRFVLDGRNHVAAPGPTLIVPADQLLPIRAEEPLVPRALVARYMARVIDCESVSYITNGHGLQLTPAEITALQAIEADANRILHG